MSNTSEDMQATSLKIGHKLTIQKVIHFSNEWLAIAHTRNLTIDASEVDEIDTAGLQLLQHLINGVQMNKGNVVWLPTPSTHLYEQATLAGMVNMLHLSKGEL